MSRPHVYRGGSVHFKPVGMRELAYYNAERPHRSHGLEPPLARARLANGSIRARPVLAGLHHVYRRDA